MTFQDPVLHSLWKFTITVINQFSYFGRNLNSSNTALVISETNGIYEMTFNHILVHGMHLCCNINSNPDTSLDPTARC